MVILTYRYNIHHMHYSTLELQCQNHIHIIESVDSISRDGPDTPIYLIQHKNLKNSAQVRFYILYMHMITNISVSYTHLTLPTILRV